MLPVNKEAAVSGKRFRSIFVQHSRIGLIVTVSGMCCFGLVATIQTAPTHGDVMMNTLFRPDLPNIQPIPVPQVDGWTARNTAARIATLSEQMVVDYSGISALLRRMDGAVVDSWSSRECSLLGVDVEGTFAFFTDDFSWSVHVYDLKAASWVVDADPDFPRFTLEEDGDRVWVVDLDTRHRYRVIEATSAEPVRARIA